MCVCVCMYACVPLCLCVYICMPACMCACTYAYVCMYACMCMCVGMYACLPVHVCVHMYVGGGKGFVGLMHGRVFNHSYRSYQSHNSNAMRQTSKKGGHVYMFNIQ